MKIRKAVLYAMIGLSAVLLMSLAGGALATYLLLKWMQFELITHGPPLMIIGWRILRGMVAHAPTQVRRV